MTLNPITIAARILLGRLAEQTEEAVLKGLVNAHAAIESATSADGLVDLTALVSRYPQLLPTVVEPTMPTVDSQPGQPPAIAGGKRGKRPTETAS